MEKLTKIFFVLLSAIALTGCAEQTKPVPDPEGSVGRGVKKNEGNETMYSTNIDIQNDGKDGNAIYIVLDKGVIQQ